MPAKSKAQQRAMAIALHEPGKLYKRNKGLMQMSDSQLREFATTPRKKLPAKVKSKSDSESHSYNWRNHQGRR